MERFHMKLSGNGNSLRGLLRMHLSDCIPNGFLIWIFTKNQYWTKACGQTRVPFKILSKEAICRNLSENRHLDLYVQTVGYSVHPIIWRAFQIMRPGKLRVNDIVAVLWKFSILNFVADKIKSRISKMRNHFKRKLSWVSDYTLDLIFPPKIPFEMMIRDL